MKYFETIFLEEVEELMKTLDNKSRMKVMFNVRVAEQTNNTELFKKLNANIWEFRTKYLGKQIRLLAFWDKTKSEQTLVIATNGFIKKTQKKPVGEIERAERIRRNYFEKSNIENKK